MATELVTIDFETASTSVFDSFAGPPTFPSGVAYRGTYVCRIEPPGGVNNFGIFPAGPIVGAIGTAGAKRIVIRGYMRINAFPNGGGAQARYARVLSVAGPQNGHAVVWLSGDTTSRSGVVLDGRFGLSVNTAQGFGPPPSGASGLIGGTDGLGYDGLTWCVDGARPSTGLWYLFLFDVSYQPGGVISASFTLYDPDTGIQSGSVSGPVGYTPPALGSSFAVGQVGLGNNGSDWNAAVSVDFDDLAYYAADGADATEPLPPPITITPTNLDNAPRDEAYSHALTADGGFGPPYVFEVITGALPDGLALASNGLISGLPTRAGVFPFTVRASDLYGEIGDQALTLIISAFRIDIAVGSPPTFQDHLPYVLQADFELGLNQRSTAHVVFDERFIPDRLSEIVLYARDGVTAVFGGIILRRNVHGVAPSVIEDATDADCVDYSIYFDDASVTLSYDTAVAVEDVIADVVDQVLGDYGLTYAPTATGLTLQPFSWIDVVVTTAFKQISDKTGLVFRTSPTKEILAFVPGSDPAPIEIADANINTFDLNWNDGDRLTANTVELFCGPSGPGMMRQQWIADGVETSWVTDLPAIDPPPILVEVDDGVTPYLATVVPAGGGSPSEGQFEWDRDTHTLSLGTDPVPAAGTKITLGSTANFDSPFTFYTVQFPFKVRVTTGDLPPITYRESRPDCVEYAAGLELANGILERESSPRRDLEVLTDADGFLPGQELIVNTTSRGGLVGDFLVASVRAHLQNSEVWDYTIVAQEESVYRGSYVDEWKALTSGGASAGSSGTLTAPVSPPQSAVTEDDLSLSDVTTADVSIAKHGFAPKAPGDPTMFLNGDDPPEWAVPSGSGGGAVVQVVSTGLVSGVATGTTKTPMDDSIPTNTEGNEYMTLAITPTDAANKLRIDIVGFWSPDAANWVTVALHQDATSPAVAAAIAYQGVGTGVLNFKFTHWMTAGTTSATTFKIRAGQHTAAGTTLTFNGESAARRMGGVMASSITITEIVP